MAFSSAIKGLRRFLTPLLSRYKVPVKISFSTESLTNARQKKDRSQVPQ